MERKGIFYRMSALPEESYDPDKDKSKKRKKPPLIRHSQSECQSPKDKNFIIIERKVAHLENTLIELLEDLTDLVYAMMEQGEIIDYLFNRVNKSREEEIIQIPLYQN